MPWAKLSHTRDVYTHVVSKGLKPAFPSTASADIANIAKAYWAAAPRDRRTFADVVNAVVVRCVLSYASKLALNLESEKINGVFAFCVSRGIKECVAQQ